jgi:hypothetical protein
MQHSETTACGKTGGVLVSLCHVVFGSMCPVLSTLSTAACTVLMRPWSEHCRLCQSAGALAIRTCALETHSLLLLLFRMSAPRGNKPLCRLLPSRFDHHSLHQPLNTDSMSTLRRGQCSQPLWKLCCCMILLCCGIMYSRTEAAPVACWQRLLNQSVEPRPQSGLSGCVHAAALPF